MSFLVDTNLVSELGRPRPDPRAATWMTQHSYVDLSTITLEEIVYGLAAKPNERLERFFDRFVATYCRVHDVTPAIARHAGIMRGQLSRRGRVRSQSDMIIAATATAHGLTLVTRNERDFEGCGVAIYNPFR